MEIKLVQAENAGFFSHSNNLDYYICISPYAEQILNDRLSLLDISSVEYKKTWKLFEKTQTLRHCENIAKQKLQNKLDELSQIREFVDSGDYKKYIEAEINHLQKIFPDSNDIKKL